MSHRRAHRLTTAFIVVFSLLFAQLAMASYVCPQQANLEAMAAMARAGQACDGMDPQQPALCHVHSADPANTFEAAKLPVVSPPALVQVLVLPLVPEAREARAVPRTASPAAEASPDPLYLCTLRLRV